MHVFSSLQVLNYDVLKIYPVGDFVEFLAYEATMNEF
jgi:hypothetical protein